MEDPKEKVKSDLEEMRELNDQMEEEMLRAEQLRAKAMQGGKADAGEPQEIDPEVKNKEEAKKFFKGTGIDDAIEEYG